MTQLFQDTMAICRHFHKSDLFLTMTANPKWPEIIHSLFSGQIATDCPDIISQVFEQKKKVLLKLIDNGFFGTTVAHIHTIEFQKKGLPHIHLLIFLYPQHRIQDSHHINSMISAQLPDPQLQPLLYAKVTKYMLHGPCGVDNPQAKCMVNGKCSKHFPKKYREREQIRLRTVIHFMLGLTMAWFLNAMRLDSLINMWSLTVLNFSFSLTVISMLRSQLDWELSSI